MPSAAETTLGIAIAGTAVAVAINSVVPGGVVNVSLGPPRPEGWSVGDWIGLGSLIVAVLGTASATYFAWCSEKRARIDLEARIAKLEAKVGLEEG